MTTTTKRVLRAAGIFGAAIGTVTLMASPASAATRTAYYGNDLVVGRPYGYVNEIFVQDNTADGHGVYANVHLSNGDKVWGWQSSGYAPYGLWAGGTASGGTFYDIGGGLKVDWVQVCRDTVGCSAWVPVYDGS